MLRFRREKLLIHRLIPQHQQHRGQQQLEPLRQRQIPQHLKVRRRQRVGHAAPAARRVDEKRQRQDHRPRSQQPDEHIHVRHRRHPSDRREHNHERRHDVLAKVRGDHRRKNQVQDVSAADQLIAQDRRVRKKDRNHAQHPRRLAVARLQQIRNRELRKMARARRDEIDQQQPDPSSARQPQRGKPVLVRVLRARQQRTGPDPRRQQREDQHERGQRPPRHQIVCLGLHSAHARERNHQQSQNNCAQNSGVQRGHAHSFFK